MFTDNIYTPLDRGMVLLQFMPLKVFTQRNFFADFIRLNFNFIHKNDTFTFWALFGRVRVTYAYGVFQRGGLL